jgi:hypothetical protein
MVWTAVAPGQLMKTVENLWSRWPARRPALVAASIVLAITGGCATTQQPPAPTLQEIVQMSADGRTDAEIITRLKKSGVVYPLSASAIIDLNRKGVSPAVLDFMQKTLIDSARRQGHMINGEPFYGYPCEGCQYPPWRVPPYNFPY